MRNRILKLASVAIMLANTPLLAQEQADPDYSENVRWLYVVNSTGGSFDGKTLTMDNVPPVLAFSDRPHRIYGHMTLSELLPMVKEGPNNFVENPPNAVLSTFQGDELPSEATVTMHDAAIVDGNLTFTVDVLDGSIPESFGPASLFVDHGRIDGGAFLLGTAIGREREEDRQEAAEVYRQPTYVYTANPAPAPAAPAPESAESRLAEAQRLYQQGLITEQEYAQKRQEILATM